MSEASSNNTSTADPVPTPNKLEGVLGFLPDDGAGTRALLTQTISDFAYGCDISPVLSEKLTPRYMFENMGGLDGNYDMEESDFNEVEAYHILFEDAEFVVDRRAIYDQSLTKTDYIEKNDDVLITKAVREWFKKNVFLKGRTPGADTKFVDDICKSAFKSVGLGPLLKYGILHSCATIPGAGGKTMYIEWYAKVTNMKGQPWDTSPHFPYYHIWKHEELRFQMQRMAYSDQRYLTVDMPGYG